MAFKYRCEQVFSVINQEVHLLSFSEMHVITLTMVKVFNEQIYF